MLKAYLATSALFPWHMEGHPANKQALRLYQRQQEGMVELSMGAHSIAKAHRLLTSPVCCYSPKDVSKMIGSLPSHLRIIALESSDYLDAVARLATQGAKQGNIWVMLDIIAAERSGATMLVTLEKGSYDDMLGGAALQIVDDFDAVE